MANGNGFVEVFADVAIDVLEDDVADVVAGMNVAAVTLEGTRQYLQSWQPVLTTAAV